MSDGKQAFQAPPSGELGVVITRNAPPRQRLVCQRCGQDYVRITRHVGPGEPLEVSALQHADGRPVLDTEVRACDNCGSGDDPEFKDVAEEIKP